MTERAEFLADREAFIDAHHKHLDLTEINDAWGRPMFRHSHVEAMWDGWKKGRAALRSLASQDQKPPPAAGWDEAIEACKQVQPSDFGPVQSKQPKVNVRELVEALRTTPAATKSAYAGVWGALEPFAALVPSAFDHSYPDDAEIVLVCNGEPHAYLKNIDFRRAKAAFAALSHQSAPVAANASAEARLREALEPFAAVAEKDIGEDETDEDYFRPVFCNHAPRLKVGHLRAALKALSAHPPASDCDKQGHIPSGYGEYTPITVGGSTSDRTADVTVDDLAKYIEFRQPYPADAAPSLARALLDAFTVGRR